MSPRKQPVGEVNAHLRKPEPPPAPPPARYDTGGIFRITRWHQDGVTMVIDSAEVLGASVHTDRVRDPHR